MNISSLVLQGSVREAGRYPEREKIDSDLCFIPFSRKLLECPQF